MILKNHNQNVTFCGYYNTLLTKTERELEEALNVTETDFNNYNMKINIGKTKMIKCRTKSGKERLKI